MKLWFKFGKCTAKVKHLTDELVEKNRLLEKKRNIWPPSEIDALLSQIDVLKLRQNETSDTITQETPGSRKRFESMKKRLAKGLIEENRIKRRALGSGRESRINDECEEYVAKCIEEKASSHGRRNDTVLYTGRRVKTADLLSIANYKLREQGKQELRSCTTVWNRSNPKNKRSIQAKQHQGRGLFCTRKPYKGEDKDNENTHHQRAFVNNVKRYFFSEQTSEFQPYCLMRSIDDKAYLRPGTSEGFRSVRNGRILVPSAVEKMRRLPKYDWPEKAVYITPSTHRFIHRKGMTIDNKEILVSEGDRHVVFVRPKFYVDSSGTTWASETVELRYVLPDEFEVPVEVESATKYSVPMRQACAKVQDSVFQFVDMTEKCDVMEATAENTEQMAYEVQRIDHLCDRVQAALDNFDIASSVTREEVEKVESLNLQKCLEEARSVQLLVGKKTGKTLWKIYKPLLQKWDDVLRSLKSFNLPAVKPRICDLSDAGPGVGVSNLEVRFRDAELARLHNSEYRIRIHRSRDDSAQNEAERTNSAIGDSVVDGSTIQWNKYKLFDGLTDAEISNITLQEYEQQEAERMEKNAWYVAQEVKNRVDGAPVLGEFISAFLTKPQNEQFFFCQNIIKEHNRSGAKSNAPGKAYYTKIRNFIDEHYIKGELYMEYVRGRCEKLSAAKIKCDFCKGHPHTITPELQGIPQPKPDRSKLPEFHYLDVFVTPYNDENGRPRPPDEYQPRSNITKQFQNGSLSLTKEESIERFSRDFIVEERHIRSYLEHLLHLKRTSDLRRKNRQAENELQKGKQYNDYNWDTIATSVISLLKLKVCELDKYLDHHGLSKVGRKKDKAVHILAHKLQDSFPEQMSVATENDACEESDSDTSHDDDEDSDYDTVLAAFGESDEEEDSSINELHNFELATRTGRRATTWYNRYGERLDAVKRQC